MPQALETPLCERIGREAIERQVARFYAKLRVHPELGPRFAHIDDFARHERRLADFWWQALGGRLPSEARGFDMALRHEPLALDATAFATWQAIFRETLHEHLPADLAEAWMRRVTGIAAGLERMMLRGETGIQIRREQHRAEHEVVLGRGGSDCTG